MHKYTLKKMMFVRMRIPTVLCGFQTGGAIDPYIFEKNVNQFITVNVVLGLAWSRITNFF